MEGDDAVVENTKVYVSSRTSQFDKEVLRSNGARNYSERGPTHKNTNSSSPTIQKDRQSFYPMVYE